jgi:hypothetical protein
MAKILLLIEAAEIHEKRAATPSLGIPLMLSLPLE